MGPGLVDFTSDEYSDIYYNPFYLNNIEGTRVYSNLSNLSGAIPSSFLATDVNMLSNYLYPTNMVGVITEWKGQKIGAIYSSSGFSVGGSIIDEDIYSDNEDYTYDSEDELSSEVSFGGRDLNLFYSNKLFGILIKLSSFKAGMTYSDESQSFSRSEYNMGAVERTTTSRDEYDVGGSNYLVGVSFGRAWSNRNLDYSLAFGVEPAFVSLGAEEVDYYLRNWVNSSTTPVYSENLLNDMDNSTQLKLSGYSAFMRYRKQKNEDNASSTLSYRSSLAFIPFGLDIESEDDDRYSYGNSNSSDYDLSMEYEEENYSLGGAAILGMLQTGYGREYRMDQNSLLAMGIKGTVYFAYITAEDDPKTYSRTYYTGTPNDGISDNDYGYVYEETDGFSQELSGYVAIATVNVPIGIETPVFNSESLKFRLGANALFPVFGYGNISYDTQENPDMWTRTFTHGPDAGRVQRGPLDSDYYWNDESKTQFKLDKMNLNLSSYYFGLGWQINENLSLDVLHFSNLTNLSTWWFSLGVTL
jgi:hypothetical protein